MWEMVPVARLGDHDRGTTVVHQQVAEEAFLCG